MVWMVGDSPVLADQREFYVQLIAVSRIRSEALDSVGKGRGTSACLLCTSFTSPLFAHRKFSIFDSRDFVNVYFLFCVLLSLAFLFFFLEINIFIILGLVLQLCEANELGFLFVSHCSSHFKSHLYS